jgi:CRP-like cAMP-binding protein
MSCNPNPLRPVPLFSLLDPDEMEVLASQVEYKQFAARQGIYKKGDAAGQTYVIGRGELRI